MIFTNKKGQEEGGPNKAIIGMLILVVFLVIIVVWQPKAIGKVKAVTDKIVGFLPEFSIGEKKLSEEAIPADVRRAYEGLVGAFENPPAAYYCTVGINSFEDDRFWIELRKDNNQLNVQLWTTFTDEPYKKTIVDNQLCSAGDGLIDGYKDYLAGKTPKMLLSKHFTAGQPAIRINSGDPIKLFAYEDGDLCIFAGDIKGVVFEGNCIRNIDTENGCRNAFYPKCEIVSRLTQDEIILTKAETDAIGGWILEKRFYGHGWIARKSGLRREIKYPKDVSAASTIVGLDITSHINKLPKLPIKLDEIKQKAVFEAAQNLKDYIDNIDPREIELARNSFNKAKQILTNGKEGGKTYEQIIDEVSGRNGVDPVLMKSIITHESLTTAEIQRCVSGNSVNNNCVLNIRSTAASNGVSQVKDETIADLKKRGLAPDCDFYSNIECQIKFGVAAFKDKLSLAQQYMDLDKLPEVASCCTKDGNVIIYSCGGVTEEYASDVLMAIRAYNGVGCGGQPDVNYVRNVLRYYPYYAPPVLG